MILVLKPFKVNDRIMAQGEKGIVRDIQIFNTFLYTDDNKVVILPNGPVANGNIVNFTREATRRIECFVSLDVDCDAEKVKELILKVLNDEKDVLKENAPFVGIEGLHTGALVLTVRVWVKTENHQAMYYVITDLLNRTLSENNIRVSNIPTTPPVKK